VAASLEKSHRPRVAVIGGGISGLAAAHRLLQLLPHAELHLYEASDRLGGPLQTIRTHNSVLEQGADSFLIAKPWALELCRELGLADQLIPTNEHHRRALVVRNGKLLPVPEGFVLMQPHDRSAIWRSPVLSVRGKLRMLSERFIRRPAAVSDADYDESVESFASRRLGREAYERLVQPLVAGIFVADASKLSLAATYPEFLEAEQKHGSLWRAVKEKQRQSQAAEHPSGQEVGQKPKSAAARYGQFVTLRRGISSLIEALTAALPNGSIHLRTSVDNVARAEDGRWTLTLRDREQPTQVDGLIVAAPAPVAGKLIKSADPQLGDELNRIEYASSVVVTLTYRRGQIAHPLNGFGAVVPLVENRPIVAVSFSTVKFPSHAPADHAVVRVFMGGALNPQLLDRNDQELVSIAEQQLAELIGAQGQPMEVHVARWPQSMAQYHVGHWNRVEAIEERAAALPRLQLAGNAYHGVGIPQCIHSGRTAAEKLANELK
jgi:oxygen-dependent protoporphyrinogen oxidase